MAPAIQKKVAKIFHPAKLYIMYGATEASARLSYLDPNDLPRKWGSIGKAIPNVELFIADDKGNQLAPGSEGEIVARGANIMNGYWNDAKETAKVLKNGLYYTGDIGVMDEEGYLYVVGRSKDMIKVGGNRVSAKEIEEVLYAHTDISEVAVIGVDDDILGEAIKAFVVLKNGRIRNGANKMIMNFLKEHLAPYKLPKFIEYRDSLPKNESGKIQKLKLK
jgi:long-chain acyl-CoA synthetase